MIECANFVGHPRSYPQLLREYFLAGEDFCIIEHDNESRPHFLDDLRDCPQPWCFFAYDLYTSWEDATSQPTAWSAPLGVDFAPLGHTRFKAGLGQEIESILSADYFLSSWVSRDTFISGALTALGYIAHRHPGKAIHWHPYPEHGSRKRSQVPQMLLRQPL